MAAPAESVIFAGQTKWHDWFDINILEGNMRLFKMLLMGFLWVGILRPQVRNIPDFEYVKRVFAQPAYWDELHIQQEIGRYLDAMPVGKHSSEMRYFLAMVYEKQEEIQNADYSFRAARFLTRDSLLSRRITIHLKRLSTPQPAALAVPKNKPKMLLVDLFYNWLQAYEKRVTKENQILLEKDCGRFLNHFPASAHADNVVRMLSRLQEVKN